jgi:hypothetical protein
MTMMVMTASNKNLIKLNLCLMAICSSVQHASPQAKLNFIAGLEICVA